MSARRGIAAWAFAALAIVVAIATVRAAGGPTALVGVDQLISGPSSGLTAVGGALPFGYAFAAGMLAAVNPCGFAMLPAYLGLFLGSADTAMTRTRRLLRAVVVALTMTAAFIITFGLAGVAVAAAGSALGHAFPFIGLVIGLLLAAAGAYILAGGKVYSSLGDRFAARLSTRAGGGGLGAYAAYGLAYAAASLGCALPIFLTVVGVSSAGHNAAASAAQFALYGLGMGFVITVLTVLAAIFKVALLGRVRSAGARLLDTVTGVLLVLTGAYVTAYWLTLGF